MRPLYQNVFVKELQNNGNTTPEGIVLPETIELQYEIGAVIAVGEGTPLPDGGFRPPIVKPGNLVAYHAGSGVRVMVGADACRLVLESNIIAVLEENCVEEVPEEAAKH